MNGEGSTGRGIKYKGEKGMLPYVGCVDVLGAKIDLVQVLEQGPVAIGKAAILEQESQRE